MAVFMVATLLLAASMAVPSVLTEGRRETEQEVIWRGNQYVRAIRLYYQKNGRFPQSMDDLTKASNNGTYFLRKAYTDLLNPDEQGEWRLIYASPTGQLTGSVRYHSLQEMALAQGMSTAQNNALQSAGAGSSTQQSGGTGTQQAANQTAGQLSGQPSGQSPEQSLGQLGQLGQTGQPGTSQGSAQNSPFAPTPISSGPVFGGYLVGVGCKVKKPSLIVYKGGKTYYEWEFIWNPLTVTAVSSSQATLPSLSAPASALSGVLGAAPGTTATSNSPAASGTSGSTGTSPSPTPAPSGP